MTVHNEAGIDQIASTVLMPGDPRRAEWIAQTYLTGAECVNRVRGMLCYTGSYKGRRISVMGSGMGMPSMSIYSEELYSYYGVERIVRIGTCGALQEELALKSLVVAQCCSTDSGMIGMQSGVKGTFCPPACYGLIERAVGIAGRMGVSCSVGGVLTTDSFYTSNRKDLEGYRRLGVLGVEMETAALYYNACKNRREALSILSVSDHIFKEEALSAKERQETLETMVEVAIEVGLTAI